MTCEVPRTYIPVPDLTPNSGITVPLNITDPNILRNVLQQIVNQGNAPQNTSQPPGVTNFVATSKTGGTLLTWDFSLQGGYYLIYRGATNDLSQARAVAIVAEGVTARGQFMDPCGQETAGTIISYWIQPYSAAGIPGGYSYANKACVDCGAASTLTFQDPMTGTTSFYAGNNWDVQIVYRSSSMPGTTLDGALNTGVTGVTWGSVAGVGAAGRAQCFPILVDTNQMLIRSATNGTYAQMRFVSQAGAGVNANFAICAMAYTGEFFYSILMSTITPGQAYLSRCDGNFSAETILDATLMTYVANDLMRLECRPVGTTVEITTYKNGVFNKTFVDSSASRRTSGLVGFGLMEAQANATITMKDFDGGAL